MPVLVYGDEEVHGRKRGEGLRIGKFLSPIASRSLTLPVSSQAGEGEGLS